MVVGICYGDGDGNAVVDGQYEVGDGDYSANEDRHECEDIADEGDGDVCIFES